MATPSLCRRLFGVALALGLCALPAAADDAFQVTQDVRFVRVNSWVTETQSPFGQDFEQDEIFAVSGATFDEVIATDATFLDGLASSHADQVSQVLPASVVATGAVSVSGEALCCVLESSAAASSIVDLKFDLSEPRDYAFSGDFDASGFVGVQTFLLRDGVPVFNEVVSSSSQTLDLSGPLPAGSYQLVVRASISVVATGDPLTASAEFDVLFEIVPETSAWTDLGQGLAGSAGIPTLELSGSLAPSSPLAIDLAGALPNSPATLVFGLDALEAPFKGGVLVPVPSKLISSLMTNASGEVALQATWVNPSPSGVSLYLQVWLADPGGPVGFAASNGVRGDVP